MRMLYDGCLLTYSKYSISLSVCACVCVCVLVCVCVTFWHRDENRMCCLDMKVSCPF